MNSLSFLSSTVDKVIGRSARATPGDESLRTLRRRYRPSDGHTSTVNTTKNDDGTLRADDTRAQHDESASSAVTDEEGESEDEGRVHRRGRKLARIPLSIAHTVYMAFVDPWVRALRWIWSAIAACAEWVVSFFYNGEGKLAMPTPPWASWRTGTRKFTPKPVPVRPAKSADSAIEDDTEDGGDSEKNVEHRRSKSFDNDTSSTTEEITPRRSIRIRLYNEEKSHQGKSLSVKSPTSSQTSHRITRYPRSFGPPVPLLPKNPAPKTLILDLDETLIHSLAKGGRMSSGHMVEVKLDKQHAILYYVHKRPYCDEFLRKVCRWYNLVIFTASVQEYADPVIDWLEQDRKYFSGRYYRQHCTNRNGAYIKDIATVEPDLSRVMIIDNSPTSYIFHEDNAIPIEGWINDPTDIDLLNLIPLLQALQYVTDVRALLALRMGESFV